VIFLILVASGSWIIAAAAHFAEKEESRKITLNEDIRYIEHDVFFFEEKKNGFIHHFRGISSQLLELQEAYNNSNTKNYEYTTPKNP